MMLSRRMPRPTWPQTKIPWSSGPRCTSVSHICWISAVETPRPRSKKYLPTMPHMDVSLREAAWRMRGRPESRARRHHPRQDGGAGRPPSLLFVLAQPPCSGAITGGIGLHPAYGVHDAAGRVVDV